MRALSKLTACALLAGTVAIAAATPLRAQVGRDLPPAARTIRVSGVGEFRAQPNLATAQFGVETAAQTAEAAAVQNAELMDRVIQALIAAGVPREDIQTSGYSLHPEYAQDRRPEVQMQPPRIVGYRATNMVSVRTREMAQIGGLIDAALAAGANRLHGVSFEVTDEAARAAQAEALSRAVADARMAAETIAEALGVRLGPVLDASTAAQPIMPMYRQVQYDRMEAAMAAPPPTPIEPGQQRVGATASVVYQIQ